MFLIKITMKQLLLQFLTIIYLFTLSTSYCEAKKIIIDSKMTFEEAIAGSPAPKEIIENIEIVDIDYYSFDGKIHRGQIVIHKELVNDIKQVFKLMKSVKFPIQKVIPIVKYQWSDSLSMLDNNTSAFNYRTVEGTKRLSNHATGRAIDINPFLNPYRGRTGKISPKGATYNTKVRGTLAKNDTIVKEFLKLGWKWGGNWKTIKDWHHFEKK